MPYYQQRMSMADKLWGTTPLEGAQASVIKKTYLLLGMSVMAAMAGGYMGLQSAAVVRFFSGMLGWIIAMLLLNVMPRIAMGARHNPVLGLGALLLDGFVAGLVLAPILYFAARSNPSVIFTAGILTVGVFAAVTLYVMTTTRVFSAPKGLGVGIFFSLVGVIVLNNFLQIGLLGMLISGAITIFGVFVLIYATSEVLNTPGADSPIPGALMLFAGLFNVFVGLLHILLAFSSRD